MVSCSVEEADAHLLLDVGLLHGAAELLERDLAVVVDVGLLDCPVGDLIQLLSGDVRPDHRVEDHLKGRQLLGN